MGQLVYNHANKFLIDDRTLVHLQLVIYSKLRRREAFGFTATGQGTVVHGRTSVWMHPDIPVEFAYFLAAPSSINPSWIDELTRSANSPGGLMIVDEPSRAAERSGA